MGLRARRGDGPDRSLRDGHCDTAAQAKRLLEWAAGWPERTWAVAGAGERVIDVQPKLGARVWLLAAGNANKNDPNGARPGAAAALRAPGVREARPLMTTLRC